MRKELSLSVRIRLNILGFKMSIVILYNDLHYKHRPPQGVYHPENPRRIDIALNGIKREGLDIYLKKIEDVDSKFNNYKVRIHREDYVALIENICVKDDEFIDRDTYICRDTCNVANQALILSIYAMNIALNSKESLAFALVRPPGHHVGFNGKAMGASSQGFCIFNNAAAAVSYALDENHKPIVVIDIDVHHGNGTQEIFWNNPDVIHIDIHERDIYPGTGHIYDLGGDEGYGTKINIPIPSSSTDNDYIYIVREIIVPIIYNMKPSVIVISAGFDGYINDGLASTELTEYFFKFFGSVMRMSAKDLRIGIAAVLEGGYSIGLHKGLTAFLKGFIKPMDTNIETTEASKEIVYTVKKLQNILKSVYKL